MAIVFTQTHLDKLIEAYTQGVNQVRIGDRMMVFNSPADLLKQIKVIQAQLDGVPTESSSNVPARFTKGRL
jgi:hypothetical protein